MKINLAYVKKQIKGMSNTALDSVEKAVKNEKLTRKRALIKRMKKK
jgi:hypothetical protein